MQNYFTNSFLCETSSLWTYASITVDCETSSLRTSESIPVDCEGCPPSAAH